MELPEEVKLYIQMNEKDDQYTLLNADDHVDSTNVSSHMQGTKF